MVLAGAGSGKTRVITQKIAYLIDKCGYDPRHIAAVTFTNKAAREMRERVGSIAGERQLKGLRISTFHTLGLNIIRTELSALGYRPGFTIYDDHDSMSVINEILKTVSGDDDRSRQIRWQISNWKNDLISIDQAQTLANGETLKTFAAAIYAEYGKRLKAYNAVDFDDLIMLPVMLFQSHQSVLESWRERIRYLLVDEYQDTNATQYALVKLLVGDRRGLTVVGDDDQSIYAWRGARPENMNLLQQDFPNLTVIKLEQNYRSMANILKAANKLIANNSHVFEKSLWSDLGFGEDFKVLSGKDDEDEAERVITQLTHHKLMKNISYGDFAILYRGNHQSRLFERLLRERNIPYHLTGGTSFFAYAEVKDIMSYLRLITNPDDDAAFLRIINTPRREIGSQTLEKLNQYATHRGISLFSAAQEPGLSSLLKSRQFHQLHQFVQWLITLANSADHDGASNTAKTLVNDIDYSEWLQATSKDERAAERRMKNVEELINWLKHMEESDDQASTLAEIINKLMLIDILERQEQQQVTNKVQLMTLHSAKGLEFPHVFMVGMEENLLPHRVSIEEDQIEEERRLAYVGITRAQQTLTFSLARQRRRFGEIEICEPSRFLDELPQESLLWQGHGTKSTNKEVSKDQGREHIQQLRQMLSSK